MTTIYIDRNGIKHWGVMARVVAESEGGQVSFEGLCDEPPSFRVYTPGRTN
jgi:hypothetical protein